MCAYWLFKLSKKVFLTYFKDFIIILVQTDTFKCVTLKL